MNLATHFVICGYMEENGVFYIIFGEQWGEDNRWHGLHYQKMECQLDKNNVAFER